MAQLLRLCGADRTIGQMNEHDGAKPPAAWLDRLREAGHWERLIKIANESLAIDPNDPATHRHIAWAYAASHQPQRMAPHVAFLLDADPDDARNHHLAAVHLIDTNRTRSAATHIETLLRLEPNSATFQYVACVHALRSNQLKKAQIHIEEARALAPDWAPAAHLQIRMDGIHRKRARDAWDRIHRLEETLALDPQNAPVLTTIGEIYLEELDQPRDAERFFRQALFIEPTNAARQAKLLKSIRARSPFFRTLSLPASAGRSVMTAWSENRVRLLFVIVAIKAWLAFAIWVVVIGAFFTPAAKIYEWLVLAEIPRARRLPRWLAPLASIRGWPLWLRASLCATIIASAWSAVFWQAFHVAPRDSLQIIAVVFGIHLFIVGLFMGVRRLRARFGKWQDDRRRQREAARALRSSLG